MVHIDKNIPAPNYKRNHRRIYPFDEMEIGDSFLLRDRCKASLRSSNPLGKKSKK